ncbi:MAG TPA: tRNA (adenosine(37)-N6)-threonylcarbamoyltransferase complex ATPase subunit type 1 TsaE [Candidatus Sumerlaeota bacterium]|nr:tRNA (adenosine(37)-N6)-threonylcarbamoyltransferase complex ATPase subunit type 1 TsaE [Candidatus Sumerlaeota bacterium]HOR28602.1 tRNA (adenosine(37)-N6)-threonylcarbamoyltransferase complex ATPase subunit type 1 TsaE [Candidatus Sumerlaeota bacterium]HPK03781.1 tRNA (adenosine(37)-N6)-threonylcarbamoyltransferase complex ATPase subunit type 1 TsaE [Candidatus Sumerlaeota bacterium]
MEPRSASAGAGAGHGEPLPAPPWSFVSSGIEETLALGRRIGAACQGGEVILLDGPMGAGKTLLTQGIAAGLGIDGAIVSPTFVVMRTYRGGRGLTLHHFDFYRLGGEEDLESVGLEDCLRGDAVVVIEWPSRAPAAAGRHTLLLRLAVVGEEARRISAEG